MIATLGFPRGAAFRAQGAPANLTIAGSTLACRGWDQPVDQPRDKLHCTLCFCYVRLTSVTCDAVLWLLLLSGEALKWAKLTPAQTRECLCCTAGALQQHCSLCCVLCRPKHRCCLGFCGGAQLTTSLIHPDLLEPCHIDACFNKDAVERI